MRVSKKIVYSLNVEDIRTVALEELSRQLARKELKLVIDNLPEYINWYDAISMAINDALHATHGKLIKALEGNARIGRSSS